jgi:hypothetical protein
MIQELLKFDGNDYVHERDSARLTGQIQRIYAEIQSGAWFTLRELAHKTGAPEASVSAQLRNLRKERFGSHNIEKMHLGNGLYTYRLIKEKL